MPLKLVPPRKGKSPNYTVRGTYLKRYVEQSTGTGEIRIARKVLARIKGEIERGEFDRPTGPTFTEAAVRYMEAGGEGRYMAPLLHHFKERAIASIDQKAIDEAAEALYPKATPATRNRHVYTPVSAVLKHAGIEHKLKRPKGSGGVQRTDWLWPEDAFRLFKEADKIDAEFGVFLRLLCYTGLRLSEALNLRWRDVKLDEAFAYIPVTKSGHPRPVYLTPDVARRLASFGPIHRIHNANDNDRTRDRVFRFTKSGRLYLLLRSAKLSAALPRVNFHGLRHTFATWMRRYAGLDVRGLVATGAWKDSQAATRYAHVVPTEEAMKAALLPTEDE